MTQNERKEEKETEITKRQRQREWASNKHLMDHQFTLTRFAK